MKTRIVLLEDHPVIRRALADLLQRDKDLTVVGEAGSARELALFDSPFDLLISDLCLPGPDGISAVGEARRRWPDRRILVLTMYDDAFRAAAAFAAGADGFAVKLDDEACLRQAVDAVLSGRRWLSPLVDAAAVDRFLSQRRGGVVAGGPLAPLSQREREVFDLMIRGYSCPEIGRQLFISPRTADTHRSHIFEKLSVHSTAELVRFAARFGLIAQDARQTCGG
ncbi:MAG TPA: response regulator transcription factor [Polyangia bacterium]|jgi:two-component system response regulator NreC|nr:response regulator transcription factor [Polyangia bacterium]